LILERTELHSPNNSRILVSLDGGTAGSYEQCKTALDGNTNIRSRLALSMLKAGDQVCVRTDEDNVALVQIKELGDEPASMEVRVTIAFTTWR
jgi:hypothetical protein